MNTLFTNKRYNTPRHAHEITFSCYQSRDYLLDDRLCEFFIESLEESKRNYAFLIWAYVLMPTHIHLLIWPKNTEYDIAVIFKAIKGRCARKYSTYLKDMSMHKWNEFLVPSRGRMDFRLWQSGGGFDRNLWNATAIHHSITYIEGNPVRKKLVLRPEDWRWSSAHARMFNEGLMPDVFQVPVLMK